jgi:hypothetical protein
MEHGLVWTLAMIYFGFIYGLYSLAFFLPTGSYVVPMFLVGGMMLISALLMVVISAQAKSR